MPLAAPLVSGRVSIVGTGAVVGTMIDVDDPMPFPLLGVSLLL